LYNERHQIDIIQKAVDTISEFIKAEDGLIMNMVTITLKMDLEFHNKLEAILSENGLTIESRCYCHYE